MDELVEAYRKNYSAVEYLSLNYAVSNEYPILSGAFSLTPQKAMAVLNKRQFKEGLLLNEQLLFLAIYTDTVTALITNTSFNFGDTKDTNKLLHILRFTLIQQVQLIQTCCKNIFTDEQKGVFIQMLNRSEMRLKKTNYFDTFYGTAKKCDELFSSSDNEDFEFTEINNANSSLNKEKSCKEIHSVILKENCINKENLKHSKSNSIENYLCKEKFDLSLINKASNLPPKSSKCKKQKSILQYFNKT